jgi:hypothetical protein
MNVSKAHAVRLHILSKRGAARFESVNLGGAQL